MDIKDNISYEKYDILNSYNILLQNNENWFLIRYICIVLDIYLDIKIELHPLRNTTELFTYHSDKYWSKIIYTWTKLECNPDMTIDEIFTCVHIGGALNYLEHWYYIFELRGTFKQNTTFTKDLITEQMYYLTRSSDLELNKSFDNLRNVDKIIANAIFYIKNIKLHKINCKYILANFIDSKYISCYLIDKVYDYFSSEYVDSSLDAENRNDLLILFYDLLDK
jgi:hypothetical protein